MNCRRRGGYQELPADGGSGVNQGDGHGPAQAVDGPGEVVSRGPGLAHGQVTVSLLPLAPVPAT